MCIGCYQEYGSPQIVSERTTKAADLVARLYEFSCVGGNLHIVTDDWNIEDDHIQWCLNEVKKIQSGIFGPHQDTDPAQVVVERELIELMASMSEEERASALAIEAGWLDGATSN